MFSEVNPVHQIRIHFPNSPASPPQKKCYVALERNEFENH